jgi:DNA-binding NtrC family response regulator
MEYKASILVVDDEEQMRDLLNRILSREGYNVQTASGGQQVLDILKEKQFDIVLADMKMPRMDGFQLLKIIKQEYPYISVVIMTAFGDTYTVKDAMLLGADEYVIKPFKSHEISLVVERTYWRILAARQQQEKVAP